MMSAPGALAVLFLNTWAGRRGFRVRVTGETRSMYRFEALERIPMPGNRLLNPGDHSRAPKYAFYMDETL